MAFYDCVRTLVEVSGESKLDQGEKEIIIRLTK